MLRNYMRYHTVRSSAFIYVPRQKFRPSTTGSRDVDSVDDDDDEDGK
jgi:hypothetical protein